MRSCATVSAEITSAEVRALASAISSSVTRSAHAAWAGLSNRSVYSITAASPRAFTSARNAAILTYIKEISPRPILFIHGEKAHSRYFTETAYAAAAQPKELVIISGANHTDLYDRVDVIPFDKLTTFFTQNLATK